MLSNFTAVRAMQNLLALLFCFFVVVSATCESRPKDSILTLPGFGKLTTKHYAGYANKLFYWYVSSKQYAKNSPIIIWTSGGPGASSLYGFFLEGGPFIVGEKQNLLLRKSAWSNFSNYLILEQPLGIGLSFAKKKEYPASPSEGNEQYFQALQVFFSKHPALKSHDIYLSGESYGATYMALLAHKILNENEKHPENKLHLKGVVIISGWVDPIVQQSEDANYLYSHGLISTFQKKKIDRAFKRCAKFKSNAHCDHISKLIKKMTHLHLHNVGLLSSPHESRYVTYLNNPEVRRAIHAKLTSQYSIMTNIWDNFGSTIQGSVREIYQQLLEKNIHILIFSGLDDASDCNFLGTQAWLKRLKWKGSNTFWKKRPIIWKIPGKHSPLGYKQQGGNLTWIKVRHAGHMVPIDQPKISALIQDFVEKGDKF